MATISGHHDSQTTPSVPRPKRIREDGAGSDAARAAIGANRPWIRASIPWTPIALSVAVILSGAAAVRPVRDAASLGDVTEAFLVRPAAYVALAPLSNVLDTLTLLSVRQHIALFAGLWVLFVGWRIWMHRTGRAAWRRHLVAAGIMLLTIVVVYGAAVLMPRPMAYLASRDPNIMRVDFHSHTGASGDARRGFSEDRNRDWHRAAGYDVAFVTDHATVAGAERALADNTVSGLESPMLLQSIEVTWTGEHVSILGAQRTYTGLLTPNLRDVDPGALELASLVPRREPVVIWHHPRRLDRLPAARGASTSGVRAIEISNGAPDGMDEVRPKREAIVAFAQQHNLTLTSGSDNHGWGFAAPNWTLMRPSNWRGLTSEQLALGIERLVRDGGFRATRVVERVVADGAFPPSLALSVVTVPGTMLVTLSTDERVMWLAWIWAAYVATRLARRRRAAA